MKRVKILPVAFSLLLISGMGLAECANPDAPAGEGKVGVERVNINTASRKELVKLKGIGPVSAERIIEYREKQGPFRKPEDIMRVKGIGRKKWEAIRHFIAVARATPVSRYP